MSKILKVLNVVGTRPNLIKVAALHKAFSKNSQIQSHIIHTGQHYDEKMSAIFFHQMNLPKPHLHLNIGIGTATYQKAQIMMRFEQVLEKEKPDLVVVVGDVNSTLACSLVSVKMGIPTAHVEAGLRSGDRKMPEEINRILTDHLCDFLFVTEKSGVENLKKEGISDSKVFFVGNVMIDSLIQFRKKAQSINFEDIQENVLNKTLQNSKLKTQNYLLLTMHRPQNVDNEKGLKSILNIIDLASQYKKIVFPIHPRTEKNFRNFYLFNQLKSINNLILLPPQGYLEFLKLMDDAALVITDSGGIQEETTFLKTPCLTFRNSTERPSTTELGTNYLINDFNPQTVNIHVKKTLTEEKKTSEIPPLWDGKAADRIVDILVKELIIQSIAN